MERDVGVGACLWRSGGQTGLFECAASSRRCVVYRLCMERDRKTRSRDWRWHAIRSGLHPCCDDNITMCLSPTTARPNTQRLAHSRSGPLRAPPPSLQIAVTSDASESRRKTRRAKLEVGAAPTTAFVRPIFLSSTDLTHCYITYLLRSETIFTRQWPTTMASRLPSSRTC